MKKLRTVSVLVGAAAAVAVGGAAFAAGGDDPAGSDEDVDRVTGAVTRDRVKSAGGGSGGNVSDDHGSGGHGSDDRGGDDHGSGGTAATTDG